MNEDRPQLAQLHWQNPADLKETILLGQTAFSDRERLDEWVCGLMERTSIKCPKGWMALLCTEGSPMFVKAAKK